MKKNSIRRLAALLSICLLLPALPARAEADSGKEEVVYVTLGNDGAAGDATVVNIFNLPSDGSILDYGPYNSVENLTNPNPLSLADGEIRCKAAKGRFYYQGELSGVELPWLIDIGYSYNYTPIAPEELAGKSGALGVHIRTRRNEKADPSFYENYMLQISVTLDSNKCRNLAADGASILNSGSDKLVTFTVMPNVEGDCVLTSDVYDFTMEGIAVNAVPLSFSIERPDTEDLSSDIDKLIDAIRELRDGTLKLKKGVKKLADGAGKLRDGSALIRQGTDALPAGNVQLRAASGGFRQTLMNLKNLTGDPDDLASEDFFRTLQTMNGSLARLSALYPANADVQALNSAMSDLNSYYGTFVNLCLVISGRYDSSTGHTTPGLADQYNSFNGQIQTMLTSLDQLSARYADLDNGLQSLSDGLDALTEGMGDLTDGTQELAGETSDMNDVIDEKIDELLADYDKSDFRPVSFASPKNGTVSSVQFVLRTEGVEKPEVPAPAEPEPEEIGFFERLLKLFR